MSESKTTKNGNLPEYEDPPVVEVALSIQFEPLVLLNSIELGSLRELWREEFPICREQPPLPHVFEPSLSVPPTIQIGFGSPKSRYWFLNEAQDHLVQLQNDKLIVNWRKSSDESQYPRYNLIKRSLEKKFEEFSQFLKISELGNIKIDQIEASYVNIIETNDKLAGKLENILKFWNVTEGHHLGSPEAVHANIQYAIGEDASGLTKMNVTLSPFQGIDDEETKILMTIQVRGTPKTNEISSALNALDAAHIHIVTSFDELTEHSLHEKWRKIK